MLSVSTTSHGRIIHPFIHLRFIRYGDTQVSKTWPHLLRSSQSTRENKPATDIHTACYRSPVIEWFPRYSGDREVQRTTDPSSVEHWKCKRPLEEASWTDDARSESQRTEGEEDGIGRAGNRKRKIHQLTDHINFLSDAQIQVVKVMISSLRIYPDLSLYKQNITIRRLLRHPFSLLFFPLSFSLTSTHREKKLNPCDEN